MDKEKIIEELKGLSWLNFLSIFLAGIVNALGVCLFLFPLKLYDGGISGLSMLLDQITPDYLTLTIYLLIFNVPIFLYGLKRQGLQFTIYSIFAVFIYSQASYVIMHVLPSVEIESPLAETDVLLCAIFGGLLSGIGSGTTIRHGGAIDGMDIISVVLSEITGLTVGTITMTFNAVLYIVAGILIDSWILPLYSILAYFIGSKTIDMIVYGIDKQKCAMILSDKNDLIAKRCHRVLGLAPALISAQNGITLNNHDVLLVVVNRFQVAKLKEVILKIDPHAFITFQDVSEVINKPDVVARKKTRKQNNKQRIQKVVEHIKKVPEFRNLFYSRI